MTSERAARTDRVVQGPRWRRWPDYVISVVGSIAGVLLFGWLVVAWAMKYQPANLLIPILLVPMGSALGTTLALAIFGRHSQVLTGVMTVPVFLVVATAVMLLSSVIDAGSSVWLILPPLLAPLGARFIVLGRKAPPPEAQPLIRIDEWSMRRILKDAMILLVAVAGLLFFSWLDRDPEIADATGGPRVCECELLTEWVENRGLTPHRTSNVRVAEMWDGFVVVATKYVGDDEDPDYLWMTFRRAGYNGVQILDEPEHWSASFFDGSTRTESESVVDVAYVDGHIHMTIRVKVAGDEWGITGWEQLWALYSSDHETALEVQRERQEAALDALEPVERTTQES